jgi:hypothetical protein
VQIETENSERKSGDKNSKNNQYLKKKTKYVNSVDDEEGYETIAFM